MMPYFEKTKFIAACILRSSGWAGSATGALALFGSATGSSAAGPGFLGSLALGEDRDERASFGTGRRVENSIGRGALHVALGVHDVLLLHHVLETCQKKMNQCQPSKNEIHVRLISI
jgi:hypothetical protein